MADRALLQRLWSTSSVTMKLALLTSLLEATAKPVLQYWRVGKTILLLFYLSSMVSTGDSISSPLKGVFSPRVDLLLFAKSRRPAGESDEEGCALDLWPSTKIELSGLSWPGCHKIILSEGGKDEWNHMRLKIPLWMEFVFKILWKQDLSMSPWSVLYVYLRNHYTNPSLGEKCILTCATKHPRNHQVP